MESPEDDAGIATSASRRESAREKDVEQTEEVDATSSYDQDSTEARRSCQTPAMSEDNFDGDSVPSPSTQDVNTSTEAILDMIDEIVDGPGAPKRLPLVCESVYKQHDDSSTTAKSPPQETTKNIGESGLPSFQIALCVASDRNKDTNTGITDARSECSSLTEGPEIVNVSSDISNNERVPVSESIKTVQKLKSEPQCPVSSVQTETSTTYSDVLSISALQTIKNISESSDCEINERTVKCVTSSETRDCVTVEKAESTSSDCSVSEGQSLILEKSTKSPLRRRLVRPQPNDRKPDSTVSSTVDSQTVNICTTVQISENITKDVSSSSDAMPAVHGNIKSDEISNVSDFSICKAETSVSSPKKIKLIRPKFVIPEGNNENSITDNQLLTSQQQDCQSSSADILTAQLTIPIAESSSNIISISDNPVSLEKPSTQSEFSEIPLPEQMSEETDKEVVNKNLSVPNTTLLETIIDHSKSDVTQETNLSGSKSESSLVSEQTETKQVTSGHCTKDDIKKSVTAFPELTDSNVNDSVLNVDGRKNTDVLLLDVSLKDEEVKLEPCISSMSVKTLEQNVTVDDNRVEFSENPNEILHENEKKLPPIKLQLSSLLEPSTSALVTTEELTKNDYDTIKQVPKLTIKLSNMQSEEMKSPTPKLTIKPLKPPTDDERSNKIDSCQQIPCVAKLNIKPILKPSESHDETPTKFHTNIDNTNAVIDQMPCVIKLNIKPLQKPQENLIEIQTKSHSEDEGSSISNINEHIPSITKLNIKPILKPPEKINDIHRKSSSSEISESECSENDETTSTSDQASVSDQGSTDIVPKVTIKMGKPGTESEGKFYTQQNIPKLTIKGLQNTENEDLESTSKLKLVISQQDTKQLEKIPKLTIKTLTKSENQPLSPKLTIKPLRPPESVFKEAEVSKTKLCAESVCGASEIKENIHVPKITIKSITKSDVDPGPRTPKKASVIGDSTDHIPFVTKLNIKPILKPMDNEEITGEIGDKVPVVSKLNIKPVIKPKDNEIDFSLEDVPKITKLNIKPIKCPEVNSSEQKDCDGLKIDIDNSSIPVITKINIKPIVKPEEDVSKYSETQSSETSNSSDDNADHIPIITKLNIKPISKPTEEIPRQNIPHEQTIPNITKLNIKPIIKPDDISSPSSPKKEYLKSVDLRGSCIPIVTKLNIKPIVKPEEAEIKKSCDEFEEKPAKNPPLVMKINIKSVGETLNRDNLSQEDQKYNNLGEYTQGSNYNKTDKSSEFTEIANSADGLFSQTECKNTDTVFTIDSNAKQNCISSNVENRNTEESGALIHIETSITEDNNTNSTLSNKTVYEKLHKTDISQVCEKNDENSLHKKEINLLKAQNADLTHIQSINKPKIALQNCTLLKKLLENTKDHLGKKVEESRMNMSNCLFNQETMISNKDMNCTTLREARESGDSSIQKLNLDKSRDSEGLKISSTDVINDMCSISKQHTIQNIYEEANSESLTKPLEINITEKFSNQSSGQDSPRIILKINKTDHGSSAKIITEEIKRPGTPQQSYSENTQENTNDSESSKKHNINSRRKTNSDDSLTMAVGKRLRSSRIVENVEKSPHVKRNMGKRPSTTETSPSPTKETELSILETKRLKLGQLLSVNKSLALTPVVTRITQTSPTKTNIDQKHGGKPVNHSILNNENCSKNGNSKLHNILSNLQAKQKQSLSFQDINHIEVPSIPTENRTHSPLSESNITEIPPKENCHTKVQEMLINENSDFRDLGTIPDDTSQDPLEVDTPKEVAIVLKEPEVVAQHVEMTPQPKKRGRPRKIPLTDSPKPVSIILPVPALEERPQRSLRLTR